MWCQRAFHRDFDGRPTLDVKEAASSDLLGKLRSEYPLEDYVRHTIGMAEFLGADKGKTYVEAFMFLVNFIDSCGDQQWAWVRYFTPAADKLTMYMKLST